MTYNFDQIIDRRNTSSVKWKVGEDELPMWVADMDFQAAPEILAAMRRVLDHGVFGYTDLSDEWYSSIIDWWQTRHGLTMEREWLMFCTGVLPALCSSLRRLSAPGENVLLMTPVYNAFFHCVESNGRNVTESRLLYDKKTASYSIDWEDLERKLADPQTNLLILCNPHNPIGKIWEKESLERIGDLCAAYGVIVIADEIHCDLTEPGQNYVPFASVSEACLKNSITCIAPTKAFNLAGLQSAAVAVPDPFLRQKVQAAMDNDGVTHANAFAVPAAIAAFTEGGPWLDALNAYVSDNRKLVADYVASQIPQIRLVSSEATYLLWLDCTDLTKGRENIGAFLRRQTGLFVCDGSIYGEAGEGFVRMNAACPRSVVEDGLRRLKAGIEAYALT